MNWHPGGANQIVSAVRRWVDTLPLGVVELAELPIPESDEYGLERILALRPSLPDGCPLEVGITETAEGPSTYVSIDTAGELAKRMGLRFLGRADMITLYHEPMPRSVDDVLEICRAVCSGAVRIRVGTFGDRLVSTSGYLTTAMGSLRLHGIGLGVPGMHLLARAFGLASIRDAQYEPWFVSRAGSAKDVSTD